MTPTEARLARVWAEVLEVENLAPENDFLELGGDSLGLTRIAHRLRAEFGVEPSMGTLFEFTTLRGLAAWLESAQPRPPGERGETSEEAAGDGAEPKPGAVVRGDTLAGEWPLSFSQERFWIQAQLEPNSRSANIPAFLRLTGPLDPAALERALGAVWRRHPGLRAIFPRRPDGRPVQVIREWTPVPVPTVDLSELPAADREARVLELARSATHGLFDIQHGPSWRMELVRVAPAEHLLLLTFHHLVFDAWSRSVLVDELARELAGSAGPAEADAEPWFPARLAAEQRRSVEAGDRERDFEHWRRVLAGPLPLLEMPIMRPPSVPGSGIGAQEQISLSPELCAALDALGRREGVTRYMVLLAVYAALLRRAGAGEEILVGCPVAGRDQPGAERMIGCFINTVVLRLRVPLDVSFRAFVNAVRPVVIEALAHRAAPFDQVLQRIGAPRPAHRTPVFQTLFNLRNVPVAGAVVGDALRIEPWKAPNDLALVELELNLEPAGGGLRGLFQFDSGLLEPASVARLRDGFLELLEHALDEPDLPLARLAVPALAGIEEFGRPGASGAVPRRATSAEARWLLEEWNRPLAAIPFEVGLPGLVARQAEKDPEGVALEDGEQTLTRRELEARSEAVARRLRRLGVGPESLVGLGLERGPGLVVGMLGILKAGGAYVPLDPAYPRDRLEFMVADARPVALVTSRALADRLPDGGCPRVYVEEAEFQNGGPVRDEASADGGAPVPIDPGQAAYVIYTSGSTGRPKGVVVEHRAVVNYVTAAVARFGLGPGDRLLQFSSPSFDASVEEIFVPLAAGATVVFRDDPMLFTPTAFLRACAERRITVLDLPTAYWNELGAATEEGGLVLPPTVRLVVFGGERAVPARWQAWRRIAGPGVRLLNAYGPTEATVSATWCDVGQGAVPAGPDGEVPIGRPLPNLRAYVVDAALDLVAPGEVGQLAVAGIGLARGYHGQPGLTAEKFVPDPFQPGTGARMYLTGDRVRIRPDGELVYLGRLDDQIKVRGFRIEPGEIEAVLCSLSGIREAVVVVEAGAGGAGELVAYLAVDVGDASASAIRQALAARLPPHLVPSRLVRLPALPKTPAGKLDRAAVARVTPLPWPDWEPALKPRNPLEAAVAEVWAQVLGIAEAGVEVDFFQSGGHSLLMMQLVARLQARFGVGLSYQAFFEAPTVDGIARALRALGAGGETGQSPVAFIPRLSRRTGGKA